MANLEIDKSYSCEYPFVKCKVPDYPEIQANPDCVNIGEIESWVPGTDWELDHMGERSWQYADALGKMILTVVSIHKPGKYPERVFYVRKWEDPDGKVFGKNQLRITTTGNFKYLIKGYRHEFEVD